MASLPRWPSRSPEEAYLFNPAFMGSLAFVFVRSYAKERGDAPATLVAIALTAVLHKETRSRLPYSTVSSLYGWLQENEELLVAFGRRATGLAPYAKQGLIFALGNNVLSPSGGHSFVGGRLKADFSPSFLDATTYEMRDIVERTKFLARWFAKSGSEVSVMAAWGIRP